MQTGEVPDPRGLLYRAVQHNVIDTQRTTQRHAVPVGLVPDIAKLEEDGLARVLPHTVQRAEFAEDFDTAVRGLEESERDAYILTELRGLSSREVGGLLDTSHMTAYRRAESARNTVRKELT
jgi:RNA polymerase sigma factor (sigma-70 family)